MDNIIIQNQDQRYLKILEVLANDNSQFEKDPLTGTYKRYELVERDSSIVIAFQSLNYHWKETLDITPTYQRESDDHTGKAPEDIVLDYLQGQKMGNITLYESKINGNKYPVVDGKHRLTYLRKFFNDEIKLTGDRAKRFWSHYISDLKKLCEKSNNSINTNKLLKKLEEGKYAPVTYSTLPDQIKDAVNTKVKINITELQVKCYDESNVEIAIDPNNKIAEDLIWQKFFKMNHHSAHISPDDIIYGSSCEYNMKSKQLSNQSSIFKEFFDIKQVDKKGRESQDEKRKLNELLFNLLLFVDNKNKWGSSSKALISKIRTKEFNDMNDNGKEFIKIFNSQIELGFSRLYKSGEILNLPDAMKGITSGNLTNIRYFIYFIYKIHQIVNERKDFSLYNDIPSIKLIGILELGANIIVNSIYNKDGVINITPDNKLNVLYTDNESIFKTIADYRKNQRSQEQINTLFSNLYDVCLDFVS